MVLGLSRIDKTRGVDLPNLRPNRVSTARSHWTLWAAGPRGEVFCQFLQCSKCCLHPYASKTQCLCCLYLYGRRSPILVNNQDPSYLRKPSPRGGEVALNASCVVSLNESCIDFRTASSKQRSWSGGLLLSETCDLSPGEKAEVF